ncbi:hypothetical protein [Mucilaginibacter sp.]|uniref:hypothetical protein n=1 Tax=Mucilaginibacter sp. TaxID=1882438 RepID=UPI00263135DC|nr:hypothetical protein [Mucilaginibacter sp.]MDB4926365.1 hypothetical protein [Mucilaginibacter sp.]
MNKFVLLFLFILFFNISKAQIKALTDNGRQVVLYDNGTWKYEDNSVTKKSSDSIKLNPIKFSKSPGATFLVKSTIVNIGIYIDPNKWTFAGHHDNETNPEYRFNLKSENGMALLETEKTQIGIEYMPEIALVNARKAALDARITTKEYRIVNNKKILFLEMAGTIKGIKFKYMGYYFSNEKGTVQLLCYTTESMYNAAYKDLEIFLNGFLVME